jgi:Sporulation and spore germination
VRLPFLRPLFSVFNVLALALLGLSSLAYRTVQQPPPTPKPPRLALAAQQSVPAVIYFSDAKVQNFVQQSRELKVTQDDPVALAQAALGAWAGGPLSPQKGAVAVLPKGSDVPTVWLRGEHFVVDLPASYNKLNYGVSGERMLLCSLARTLLEQRGKDVMFLVGGRNSDSLLGHADLHAPYGREDCSNE